MPNIETRPVAQSAYAASAAKTSQQKQTSETAGDTATASSFAGGDFNTFLKMLTTQIKYQDPMNPTEGSEFAVQLATFSGVEQQARTNQLLEQLNTQRAEGLGSVADWIGKEVRTTAMVAYDGSPLRLDVKPAEGATSVELVAYDAYNREVSRQPLNAISAEVTWNAQRSDGSAALPGKYTFKLVSMKGDQVLKTEAAGAYTKVTGAELTADGIRLTLAGGATALESEVTALRQPG